MIQGLKCTFNYYYYTSTRLLHRFFTYESSCTTTTKRSRVRKCSRVGKETRNGSGRVENEVDRKRRKVTFLHLLPSFFLYYLLPPPPPRKHLVPLFSFLPSFLFFHLLLLRDLELETTILPAGRFHLIREECSRRSFAEREKKEKKKRRRKRETLESSRPLDVYLETGHNYVANRVNEFFPACRISRATRVKSRRRVVRISRLSEFISGNKRPEIKFRFQEFAPILRYAYSSFSMRVQQSFFFLFFPVLFGCN